MKAILTYCAILFVFFCNNSYSQDGNNLFDDSFIHNIHIQSLDTSLSYQTFHDSLHASHHLGYYNPSSSTNQKPYFKASVTIDGTLLDTIGVRYKGNSTFENGVAINKFPLKIDFNEFVDGQHYDGIKKINLNNNILDPTLLRAKLATEVLLRMGIKAPRVAYAKVYVNGSYRGLYTMVEQIDKTFVRKHFSPDTTGYLHKCYGMGFFLPNDVDTFVLPIINPLRTKKSTNNYQPLIDLVLAVNNTPDSLINNDIDNNFDMQSFLDLMATNLVISDYDHYISAAWNFYLYSNPVDTKWYMLPWDYDLSFPADSGSIMKDIANPNSQYYTYNYTVLAQKIMTAANVKSRYYESVCKVINYGMDSVWINNRINALANMIGSEVENDPFTWDIPNYYYCIDSTYHQVYSTYDSSTLLEGRIIMPLRLFLNNRFSYVRNNLMTYGYNCTPSSSSDSYSTISVSSCNSYTSPSGNFTWTSTGNYQDTIIPNYLGGDSIISINLIINQPTTSNTTVSSCGNYSWNGTTYNNSGTYNYTTTGSNGCDSTATLNLTINQPTTSNTTVSSCSNYSWNGTTYSNSGTYNYTTTGSNGCDSTATLNLTINQPTTSNTTIYSCGNYSWNGNTYTNSGIYNYTTTGSNGCDSTATLNLTINQPTTSNTTISSCGNYSWNGSTYSNSGTYNYTTTGSNGCDSTATLYLTIKNHSSSSISPSVCKSYTVPSGDETWSVSGNYSDTITNSMGCDSIIQIQLSVTNIDTSISQTQNELSSNENSATSYQWLNCETNFSPIPTENNPSFTPTSDGQYAVAIEKSNCTDTSRCINYNSVSLENHSELKLSIYPNPNNGIVNIEFNNTLKGIDIEVYNITGQTVYYRKGIEKIKHTFKLEQESGVYILKVSHKNKHSYFRLIKN